MVAVVERRQVVDVDLSRLQEEEERGRGGGQKETIRTCNPLQKSIV